MGEWWPYPMAGYRGNPLTTYFVSRHSGAIEWAKAEGLPVDAFVAHLDVSYIEPGDTVIGSLPVNLAAEVCKAGAHYWHMALSVEPEQRGQELSAQAMRDAGLCLRAYRIEEESTAP